MVGASGRLPAELLARVTSLHLWNAIQQLVGSTAHHSFGDSIDFDVLLDDGTRLPPKAVFGVAATEALGFEVLPRHFSGGIGTPCFRALEAAGYQIVRKDDAGLADADAAVVEEWTEGGKRLVKHLRAERFRGIAAAKKTQFKAENEGRLFCERCKLDPTTCYPPELGDAAIEVHHHATAIADMPVGHKTRLADLKVLCANCHRVTHRELRMALEHNEQ
jgi:5-methylcytosine-specific restriction protein A